MGQRDRCMMGQDSTDGHLELVLPLDVSFLLLGPMAGQHPAPPLATLFFWVGIAFTCITTSLVNQLVFGKRLQALMSPFASHKFPTLYLLVSTTFIVLCHVQIGIVLAKAFDTSSQVGSSLQWLNTSWRSGRLNPVFCSPIVFYMPLAKSLQEEEFISSGFSCYELGI